MAKTEQLSMATFERLSADHIDAKCVPCGHSWKLERHEAFRCPYCDALFATASFENNVTTWAELAP